MSGKTSYHVVGIDGGGTGCRVAIASVDGETVGSATGGPANYATDPRETEKNLLNTIAKAAESASLSTDAMRNCVAHAGLAGVLDDRDAVGVATFLPFAECSVSDDRLTSLTGALGESDGALAAIGTGSFVAARHAGVVSYIGGWGFQVGDQASGAWLGRVALELCLLVSDGLEAPSDLTREILSDFDDEPSEVVAFARTAMPNEFATYARRVVQSAGASDIHGRALMQRGADYLNKCFQRMLVRDGDIICLSGGVGPHYADYLSPDLQDRIRAPVGTALDGALRLARSRLHEVSAS